MWVIFGMMPATSNANTPTFDLLTTRLESRRCEMVFLTLNSHVSRGMLRFVETELTEISIGYLEIKEVQMGLQKRSEKVKELN
ncbi:hypothetical protein HanRHA438_Chr15g0719731 [Helianthus annuus]|nr:hypothetical protein HanRHA438_Chr15g0719731 [Helianthus annuus]